MNYFKIVLSGFLGGFITLVLVFSMPWGGSVVFNLIRGNLIEFLGAEPVPTPTPLITLNDFWQKIVSDHALSLVAVQSFKDGKITREGSGMVVSSDGIIVTTFDVVNGADIVQVFYKDQILRAKVAKYDGFKNLAIIKVDSENMDVSRLDISYQFQPGKDIMVSGKLVELSNTVSFAQRGIINRVLSKEVILDTNFAYFLSGSKVINNSGIVIGMSYLKNGTVYLITAATIDNFLKNYFDSI